MILTNYPFLERFLGVWTINRHIKGEGADLVGEAIFKPVDTVSVSYREQGLLTLANGQTLNTVRHYLYRFKERSILVEFADGPNLGDRFVELRFIEDAQGVMTAQDIHQCGNDAYHVRYHLQSLDAFRTDIGVQGPRKAYTAVTHYSRQRHPSMARIVEVNRT